MKKNLFEDSTFPANNSSIFPNQNLPNKIVWKRPHEICDNPKFVVGGISRFDVKQGLLGDCWLLAVIAAICEYNQIFSTVVDTNQSFNDPNYNGSFKFSFYSYGKWIQVTVDDRLPTIDDDLVFLHSETKNEFWSSLLEKAYAKFRGSYESLKGGIISEAMVDFTGGVCEIYEMKDCSIESLFNLLLNSRKRKCLIGCSINKGHNEQKQKNGLIANHAYTITNVKQIQYKVNDKPCQTNMIRIRNPWGNEHEWNGPWSDNSKEWNMLHENDKKSIKLNFENDGESWIPLSEFIENFTQVDICSLCPPYSTKQNKCIESYWEKHTFSGNWISGINAGGCRNFNETFWANPQYIVKVQNFDIKKENQTKNQTRNQNQTIIICLTQKLAKLNNVDRRLSIGFMIYKIKDKYKNKLLDRHYFSHNPSFGKSKYQNSRDVVMRLELEEGEYCIIPTSYKPDEIGDFMLTVFGEMKYQYRENNEITYVPPSEKKKDVMNKFVHDSSYMKSLKKTFKAIANENEEIGVRQLVDIINEAFMKSKNFPKVTMETCRTMIASWDKNMSGKLELNEFLDLWCELQKWRETFKQFDLDNNGYFNSYELRNALNSLNYKVSNQTLKCIICRYSGNTGKLYFVDFIHCIVRLKKMFNIFQSNQIKDKDNFAIFQLDKFIRETMYS